MLVSRLSHGGAVTTTVPPDELQPSVPIRCFILLVSAAACAFVKHAESFSTVWLAVQHANAANACCLVCQ